MSLELVNTFGTLLTVAIIAATAIAAMVQLRHLRAGNQITAMLSIGTEYNGQALREAWDLMALRLALAMEDPLYREYELTRSRSLPTPTVPEEYTHLRTAVNLVGNTHEELGILIKNGVVDQTRFLDRYSWVIDRDWNQLERYIAFARAAAGSDAIWENFEYLVVLSRNWMREHPSAYPKGVPRLQLHNPWPVPPMPATA